MSFSDTVAADGIRVAANFLLKIAAFWLAVVILWYVGRYVVTEGLIWLFPENRYGYAFKYADSADQVFIEPKPHDCEWGKAPLGSKYCHFDRQISFDKDTSGNVKAVYVNWEKVQD